MRIGFVGLGRMGQAMVPRLIAAGFPVTLWNRTPEKAAALVQQGARLAADPAAVTAEADIVLTMLTDDAGVLALYDRLLAGGGEGRLFVEMSTIRPETVRLLAAQIAAAGGALIDSPVSGTVGPARAGKLMALVGGAIDDLERARPVLEALTRRIVHCGPVGSGALMKLSLNMPMAIYWQALAEALAMGVAGGLDLRLMLNTIADSPAALGALAMKIPVIMGEPEEVAFDVAGVRKDLTAMVATGQALGVPMPAGAAAAMSFAAAAAAGWGGRDLAALIPFYLEMALGVAPPDPERMP